MKPLVSILIPAHNAESWISQAVESALRQTWPFKEIIIVDDGSTDGTPEIAARYKSQNVKIQRQQNLGAATARNTALSISQGDFIQWLDADDILAPDKIEKQLAALGSSSRPRTLLSSAWGRFHFLTARARFAPNCLWQDLTPVEWLLQKMENNSWMAIESWLVSRLLANLAGPWNTNLTMDDDGEYFSRVLCAADKVVFVPEARSYVRQANAGSLSRNMYAPGKLESQFLALSLQFHHLRALQDTPRVRSACLNYLQLYFSYLNPDRPELVTQAHKLAQEMGGTLAPARLNWKYLPLRWLFGQRLAKSASTAVPRLRSAWRVMREREWDRVAGFLKKLARVHVK